MPMGVSVVTESRLACNPRLAKMTAPRFKPDSRDDASREVACSIVVFVEGEIPETEPLARSVVVESIARVVRNFEIIDHHNEIVELRKNQVHFLAAAGPRSSGRPDKKK